ncbi:MAG: lysylphosphatidylglycerol synthase domain-containing protein [Anaerolineae bacterium]
MTPPEVWDPLDPSPWVQKGLGVLRRSWVRRAVGWGVVLLIAFFWGRSLAATWPQVQALPWQVDLWPLAVSFPLLLVHLALLAGIWALSLRYLGERIPLAQATRVWLLTQIARYLPGGSWDALARMAVGSREGMRLLQGGVSVVLEMTMQTVAAVTVFLLSLLVWPGGPALWEYGPLAALVPLGLLALYPPVVERAVNAALRLAGRPPVRLGLRYGQVLALFGLHLAARVLIGAAFFCFARALYPFPWGALPALVGTFAGAWAVGFVVFFVPLGLGVREGVMTALLGSLCPLPVASAIAVGFRLWIALRDLTAALGAALAGKVKRG